MNNKNLFDQLIKKSMQEPGFRKKLIEDPKTVLQTEFGKKLPEKTKITVLEEKPDQFYLVLPWDGKTDGELSEEELDSVSGGALSYGDYKKKTLQNYPNISEIKIIDSFRYYLMGYSSE